MEEGQGALPALDEREAKEAEVPDQRIYYLEGDDPWSAKPLSLAGSLKLIRFVGELAETFGVERGTTFRIKDLLSKLDEKHLLKLLVLVTAQSEEWLQANFDFSKAIKAIMDFWEINSIGALLGKLTGGTSMVGRGVEGGEEGES